MVFGDSTIAGNNKNKLAFEKSTGSLRIGSTNNGQWLNRGRFSISIGEDSIASGYGSIALGEKNDNLSQGSVLVGTNNIVQNDFMLSGFDSLSNPVSYNKSNSYIFGYNNSDIGGSSVTVGSGNRNKTRNSLIFGNSNSVGTVLKTTNLTGLSRFTNSTGKTFHSAFTDNVNNIFGSLNSSGGSRVDVNGVPLTSSINSNFISGRKNLLKSPSHKVYGDRNKIKSEMKARIYGSYNNIRDFVISTPYHFSRDRALIYGNINRITGVADRAYIYGSRNEIRCKYLYQNTLFGNNNKIIGDADSNGDLECGSNNQIFGDYNIIDNVNSNTSSFTVHNNTIMGERNKVRGEGSLVVGKFLLSNGDESSVIGSGLRNETDGLLINNHNGTLAIGHVSVKPAIIIGSTRFSTTETGNVAIGDMTPQRKLHVSEAMRIDPQAAPPSSPSLGDIYVDSSEAVCIYASGMWNKVAGAGTCN